jgi:hypothetical protein
MRRFLLIAISILPLLVACSGGTQVTYHLQFDTENVAKRTELSLAVTRVIERRLQSMGEKPNDFDMRQEEEGSRMTFRVETEAAADILTVDLTEPFALQIMREARPGQTPDIEIDGHGGFLGTGITQEHLTWIEASEEENGKGRVTLQFTEEGRTLMGKVFRENVGRNIGLFVRSRLVAKLQVDTAEIKDDIIITGIPSYELARVFADDVNVGLHVAFTPVEL